MTNLGPSFWGPYAWKFIHIVALAYPNNPTQEEKENYKRFFGLIGNVIPCKQCQEHYCSHLIKNPITDDILNNRKKLLYWTIDIHNEVNKLDGKNVYDYDTAIELIKKCDLKTPNLIEPFNEVKTEIKPDIKPKSNMILYIILFISILLNIIFLYYNKNKTL